MNTMALPTSSATPSQTEAIMLEDFVETEVRYMFLGG